MRSISGIIVLTSSLFMSGTYAEAKHGKTAPPPLPETPPMSVLYIDNENDKDLDILIKPELIDDRTVDESREIKDNRVGRWVTACIPANTTVQLEIPSYEIGPEILLFSVTGETNPLTPIGTCYNLKMGRNYLLRFPDNPVGTDCMSAELVGPLPKNEGRRIKIPYSRSAPHHAKDIEFAPNRASQDKVSLHNKTD